MVDKLIDITRIIVRTTTGEQEWRYELRDKGTHFAMRRTHVNSTYNPGDVHVGNEAYVRGRWASLKSKGVVV